MFNVNLCIQRFNLPQKALTKNNESPPIIQCKIYGCCDCEKNKKNTQNLYTGTHFTYAKIILMYAMLLQTVFHYTIPIYVYKYKPVYMHMVITYFLTQCITLPSLTLYLSLFNADCVQFAVHVYL